MLKVKVLEFNVGQVSGEEMQDELNYALYRLYQLSYRPIDIKTDFITHNTLIFPKMIYTIVYETESND